MDWVISFLLVAFVAWFIYVSYARPHKFSVVVVNGKESATVWEYPWRPFGINILTFRQIEVPDSTEWMPMDRLKPDWLRKVSLHLDAFDLPGYKYYPYFFKQSFCFGFELADNSDGEKSVYRVTLPWSSKYGFHTAVPCGKEKVFPKPIHLQQNVAYEVSLNIYPVKPIISWRGDGLYYYASPEKKA